MASAYDIYVNVTGEDPLVPDGIFYSMKGRYIDLLLQGYGKDSISWDLVPADKKVQAAFLSVFMTHQGNLPRITGESIVHVYMIGVIYLVLGYATIWIRILNVCLSILSVYMLFRVAKTYFGDLAANLFLLSALFLPTQFGYSITMSRDFLRLFIVSFMIWVVYNVGGIWLKKLRLRLYC